MNCDEFMYVVRAYVEYRECFYLKEKELEYEKLLGVFGSKIGEEIDSFSYE